MKKTIKFDAAREVVVTTYSLFVITIATIEVDGKLFRA